MTGCVQAGGDFVLDLGVTGQPFACLLNGGTYDDVVLAPVPHFATDLDRVPTGSPSGPAPGLVAPTAPSAPTAPNAPSA